MEGRRHRPEILVNNAGIYPRVPLVEMTEKDFQRVISVNLTGTFLCSREVSRRMVEQGRGGCIINIASIDALHPAHDGMVAYDASKGGVLTMTKSMARELGRHDIRVNAIAPGGIVTEGVRSIFSGPASNQGKAQLKSFMSRMVIGRMGEADEIGRVALFLASDLASYITGTLIVADGGYLIG
jgi:2-deoxy-D-gluconate 3-dehydrogenase